MAQTERGGLSLVVENYNEFMRQTGDASGAMSAFGQAAQETAQQVTSSTGSMTGLGKTTQDIAKQLVSSTGSLDEMALAAEVAAWQNDQLSKGIMLTGDAVKVYENQLRQEAVAQQEVIAAQEEATKQTEAARESFLLFGIALTAVSAQMTRMVLDTTLVAARIKELEILLEVTRQNAVKMAQAEGNMAKASTMSSSAVQAQVEAIRDLHISGQVANETVAALIRYNLDWSRASELVREAQDAATFAAQDSSQAVEGLIHGITTLQPRILRSYGIMVNLNEAYRDYAAQNDLVATDLTQAQRQQAAFNAVLAQAPNIAGAYEASLGSASKQIRSIYTDTQNLAEAYGEFLEPALAAGAKGVRELLQALTELPAPLRAAFSGIAAGGAATLTLATGAATAVSALIRLKSALDGLSGIALVSSQALLGWGGILTAGISAALAISAAVEAHEKAENDLQSQILASTDSYADYIDKMKEAGFEQDILAEAIWETVRAKEAEAQLDQAKAYIEARQAVEDMVLAFGRLAPSGDQLRFIAEGLDDIAKNDQLADIFAKDAEYLEQLITSGKTFAGASVEDARKIVEAWTLVAAALQSTATLAEQEEAIFFIENLKEEMTLTGEEGVLMALQLDIVVDAIKNMGSATGSTYQEMIDHTEELNEAWARTFTRERMMEKADNFRSFWEDVNSELDRANQSMQDATLRRNRALEDLDAKYHDKSVDAWIDYQRELQDTEGDLAAFHAGTLSELLDLDREYLQDRQDAWTKYQQDLADAERDLQRDIEDANRDRAEKLADIDREYAQDREDALRDLNQDLEDMAEDHAQNLVDIEQDRQKSLLDLEQEYQDKLYDIQNLAAQRLRDLQDEYAEKESDARLKYLRQALEYLRDEGIRVSDAYEDILRQAFLQGDDKLLPFIVQSDVREMYAKLLEELAGLNDDQRWEEEDLSDDIDREQENRLKDLEEWLAEEQAAIDSAYEEKISKENERFAEEQEARRTDYERKLVDLQRALERERAELAIDHQRKLDDIRLQAERERQAVAEQYARRLEDLEIEYNREKELIGTKLDEQNRQAREKYQEALDDLATAKEREREEINTQYDRAIQDAGIKLDRMVADAAEKYGFLPGALQPTYRILKDDLHALLFGDADSLTNQWQSFIDNLRSRVFEARSPSRVMAKLAEDALAGWEKGASGASLADALTGSFDASAFQANMQAAIPGGIAAMPAMGMGGGNITNTRTSNLTVNAQYQHQSEASLRDDLSLWSSMMGVWG